MVSLWGMLQAPIQAMVRPAMWLPGIKKIHSHTQMWKIEATPEEFARELIEAVKAVMEQPDNIEYLDIHKVTSDGLFIRIFAFTRAEWLDVVELKYTDGYVKVYVRTDAPSSHPSKCPFEANSFSSGLVPLIVPGAAICNIMCCFAPFLDMGFNENRLNRIRFAMKTPVDLIEETL